MINLTPLPALHHLRDLVDFNELTAAQLVRERKTAIKSGELKVKDDAKGLMSLLMKSNMTAEAGMRLTDDELVASTSMIVFTATDTTSAALTRLLHVLALYPGVQDKLCAEILAAPEHLDHDALVALPYLDAVIHESLRLYPPVAPALFRECVFIPPARWPSLNKPKIDDRAFKDTVLPLNTPIISVDGTPMHALNVPKGTSIYVAIWGADAGEFRPERWANGKVEGVTMRLCGIYGNTMTFLGRGGGRSTGRKVMCGRPGGGWSVLAFS
ncbi:cytochrome P450 [Mycena vulgaris]|nr:cytochrome P450 [Mycena vulgaris]